MKQKSNTHNLLIPDPLLSPLLFYSYISLFLSPVYTPPLLPSSSPPLPSPPLHLSPPLLSFQEWLHIVPAKQAYFHAVAQHRLGLVAQANKNYGEAVARMKVSY